MAKTSPKTVTADQWQRIASGLDILRWACILLLLLLALLALFVTAIAGEEVSPVWLGVFPPLMGILGIRRIRAVIQELRLGVARPGSVGFETDPVLPAPPVAWERAAVGTLGAIRAPTKQEMEPAPRKPHPAPAAGKESALAKVDWEQWVGQKLLQKVGILIVLVGMVVFLKYSFDNNLIGELGRIALGALVAAALIGTGEWFSRKYALWSQAFTGGGLALAYFTIWAAHVFYHTELLAEHSIALSQTTALLLYALITAIGALAALRYKSQTIAWFTVLGGYLTPLLISLPPEQSGTLTAYLAILAAGLLALAWRGEWAPLSMAAFTLTECYLFARIFPATTLSDSGQIVIAVGFFTLFALPPLLSQFRLKRRAEAADITLILLNGGAAFFSVVDATGGFGGDSVGLVSLLLAVFYIACAGLALRTRCEDRLLITAYLLAGIGLIALALYAQMTWEWVAAGWAPYSVLLAWVAARHERRRVLDCAMLLLCGSIVFLAMNAPVFAAHPEALWHPFTSHWGLLSYVVFGSLVAWTFVMRRLPKSVTPSAKFVTNTTPLLHGVLAAIAFAAVTFEATGLHWVVTVPLALAYLAFSVAAIAAFALTGVTVWFAAALLTQLLVLLFTFSPIGSSGMAPGAVATPILHPWAGVSLITLATIVCLVWTVTRRANHPVNSVWMRGVLCAVASAQVWTHVSVEIQHLQDAFLWPDITLNRVLSLWWMVFSVPFFVRGLSRGNRTIVRAGIFALSLPLLKDLFLLLRATGGFHELTLWTVLPMSLMVAGSERKSHDVLMAGMVMLGSTMAADVLRVFTLDVGLLRTVWWGVAAIVTIGIGFRFRERVVRHLAIGMFGVAVVKLMVFDLAALSTGVRILASIVTGLLLIGASYLYQRFNSQITASSR